MPYASVKDLNLYYEELGHGEPIFLAYTIKPERRINEKEKRL